MSIDIADGAASFVAIATFRGGITQTLSDGMYAEWEVTPAIATISPDGVVTPLETGTATVTATFDDISTVAELVISDSDSGAEE